MQCEGILSRAVEASHLEPEALSADLGAALADAFASEPHSLLCAPKLLAIPLGDYCVGDADVQLYGVYAARWPADGVVWLPIDSASVAYRVKAIVEKTGEHFVAHFRGGSTDTWYTADDTEVVSCDSMPDCFPMLCFLEHQAEAASDDWEPRQLAKGLSRGWSDDGASGASEDTESEASVEDAVSARGGSTSSASTRYPKARPDSIPFGATVQVRRQGEHHDAIGTVTRSVFDGATLSSSIDTAG